MYPLPLISLLNPSVHFEVAYLDQSLVYNDLCSRIPGGATHKANGYMSEPEHGYESDYASVDAYSGIGPHKP